MDPNIYRQKTLHFGPLGNTLALFVLFCLFSTALYFIPQYAGRQMPNISTFYFFIGIFALISLIGAIGNLRILINSKLLEQNGILIQATITKLVYEPINNGEPCSQFRANCTYLGKEHVFYSGVYWADIHQYIQEGHQVGVKIHPTDSSKYIIDTSFLPNDIREKVWPKENGPLYIDEQGPEWLKVFKTSLTQKSITLQPDSPQIEAEKNNPAQNN